jgi:hypothetical protein
MDLSKKFLVLLLLLALVGCAGGARRQLLQVDDWRSMPDDELMSYYFALDDEIDRCLAQGSRGSVGVGTGVGSRGIGFGVGISQGISGCSTEGLRERRAFVRSELRTRGLIQ